MTCRPRRSVPRLRLAVAVSVALAAIGASNTATANDAIPTAPIAVHTCNDSGPGSLREAYAAAVDGDVVDLSDLGCSTITLTSGPIVSAPDAGYVTLQGAQPKSITLDAHHAGRAIVHRGARVAVNHIDITGGRASDADGGGCIFSTGDVALLGMTLSDCEVATSGTTPALGGGARAVGAVFLRSSKVTGNRVLADSADADGGGIHAKLLITAFQSTVSDNGASGDGSHYARGGGAYASEYLRVVDTTVSGNLADTGGALWVGSSTTYVTPSVVNTTISGNHAEGAAGGVLASDGMNVDNSTITGNTAVFDFGAGLYVAAGTTALHSTIVANNTSGDGLRQADIGGQAGLTIAGAHNLVMASTLTLPGDTITSDPLLGPLADHGGDVQTHALLRGSPAIDAGENRLGLYNDERDYVCPPAGPCQPAERTFGPATDIGAFEFGSPDRIFANAFDVET